MKKIILASTSILILGSLFFVFKNSEGKLPEREAIKQVTIIHPVKGPFTETVEFSGIVKGEKEALLSPKLTGTIRSISKEVGESVVAGEVLVTLEGSELYAQSDMASETIKSNENRLEETEDYYKQLVNESESALKKAKKAYDIAKESDDNNAIEIAKRDVKNAEEALESAKKMEDLQTRSAEGQLEVSKKQLDVIRTQIGNTVIKSPFSGIITSKFMEIGSLASPSSPILAVAVSSEKEVEISIPSSIAQKLSSGQEVEIVSENESRVMGSITSISPVSDFQNRKSNIIVTFSSDEIAIGSFVTLFIPSVQKENVLSIPLNAVVSNFHDRSVFVVENGKAIAKPITIGIIDRERAEVIEGISESDAIITEGHHYIKNNEQVSYE